MKSFAVAAGTVAVVMTGAGAASAGEVTGNGKPIEVHGASICAYSGQNDEFHDDESDDRVQSFGQIVAAVGPIGGIPGGACNPTGGGE